MELLLENMLGRGPADEDPFPPPGVDPHPVADPGFEVTRGRLLK